VNSVAPLGYPRVTLEPLRKTMSKPAARIGDMHVCPMVTPGTPPVPHVGGPVTGPGCPTVLIGGVPAAVMGDMCTCVGPPDTITLGSTGVLIGGKPAARMGDMCVHGGSIVVGCPTVLIGEVSPDGAGSVSSVVNNVLVEIAEFDGGVEGAQAVRQVLSMTRAANEALPFCELCEAKSAEEEESEEASSATSGSTAEGPATEEEPEKNICKIYFSDEAGNEICEVTDEESVKLVIEGENIAGEELIVNLYDNPGDFAYQGKEIENNQLIITASGDLTEIDLEVRVNS